jgi:hypothetical protein
MEYRPLVAMVVAVGVEVGYPAATKDGKLRDQGGKKSPCPEPRVCQAVVKRLTEKTGAGNSMSMFLQGWAALSSDLVLMEMIWMSLTKKAG